MGKKGLFVILIELFGVVLGLMGYLLLIFSDVLLSEKWQKVVGESVKSLMMEM